VRIKSFFADTVAAAIREARQELGEEAMLLKSSRAPEDAMHLGVYEVVFGVSQDSADPLEDSEGIWNAAPAAAGQPQAADGPEFADAAALYQRMIELDFGERLAVEFVERVNARLLAEGLGAPDDFASDHEEPSKEVVERVIALEAERFFRRDSSLGENSGGVAALIGPPGCGKTSTVVRLAVACGLAQGRRVVLLAAHDHRIGATGRLLQYASLLGVECHSAASPKELWESLKRHKQEDLILIDTPGFGPRDMEQARVLADFFAQRRDVETHLVLPATMKADDLRAAAERFEVFRIDRLLFTRLDETSRPGPVFTEAATSRKPISFLTTGQQVPGDIQPASQFHLPSLLGKPKARMVSAA
jgi:flagellar biosynthesis protein FlhF